MKRRGVTTGLGDRLGNYLIFAMLGEIKKIDIYTTWIINNRWTSKYPDDIFDYISFPKRLKFVSEEEFKKLRMPELKYRWVYHGFDYMPESIYKSLMEDKDINCTYDEMLEIYRKVSKELFYKKDLPIEFKDRPGIIHMRRGDKGNNNIHADEIINIVEKLKNNIQNWVITSDSPVSSKICDAIPNLLKPNWSDDIKIRTLEEFFSYSHSSIIIQSVGGLGNYGGWSGFSYVPFQLGLSIYKESPGKLISCSRDEQDTRLTHAKKYVENKLYNIFMYDNLEQI